MLIWTIVANDYKNSKYISAVLFTCYKLAHFILLKPYYQPYLNIDLLSKR